MVFCLGFFVLVGLRADLLWLVCYYGFECGLAVCGLLLPLVGFCWVSLHGS